MSYHNDRRSRQPFQRSSSRGQKFAVKKTFIRHDKYVNQGVSVNEPETFEITHQFSDFGLEASVLQNITSHGYTVPTPIQDQAIPQIMQGKDVVGLANTGTGKTAAFLLPLINRVILDRNQGVLILAPTRELVVQILDELKAFIQGLDLSYALCIGGANITSQISQLRRNPHFVVATPGRLKDLLQRQAFNPDLFTNIVLDEVDRMLDIGFVHDIRFIVNQLPKERSSFFFSATMTPEVENVMKSFVHEPVVISVKQRETNNHIHQDVIKIKSGESKIEILVQLLQKRDEFSKVIVFGRTKHGINKLERVLSDRGLRVSAIHGNKSQGARQRSLQLFKQDQVQALLATDIAARGIDVSGVTHVINYDEPNTYEDYVHRIGRTGRAGNAGKALTFVGG